MDMAINSPDLDLQSTHDFARRLQTAIRARPTPLLVLQLPELERVAWRHGFAAAKMLERQALRAFACVAAGALRGGDCVSRDPQSDTFLIALIARGRGEPAGAQARDCRTALARLAAALSREADTTVRSGWTLIAELPDERALEVAIARALEYGARERERLDFFSAVSHELRTPLSSIRGYLETLIDGDFEAAQARRFLAIARHEALRMERLLGGMLELSLLDLAPPLSIKTGTDLREGCMRAADAVQPIARQRGASVQLGSIPAARLEMESDRFVQAITNVVLNAVRHGRDRGLVAISARRLGRFAEICVDDNGPGIAPGDEQRIFDFAARGRDVSASGMGIGLALVRTICDRAGGGAVAERSPLGGARIVMRVPLVKAE